MSAAAQRAQVWLRQPANLLFLLLLLLLLVPLHSFRNFPSVDGPNHLYAAHVLREIHGPGGELYRHYYSVNTTPEPNWLTPLILAGLMAIVSPLAAQKILLTAYLFLLPIAARYALGAFGRRGRELALLIFPLVYNWMFYMGFYNFVFSLALYFLVAGYALRRRLHFSTRDAIGLALLLFVLYFCHLVSFVQVAVLLFFVWLMAPAERRFQPQRWLLLALAFVPSCMLALWFIGSSGLISMNKTAQQLFYFGPWKIRRLFDLYYSLVVFRESERIWTTLFAAGILCVAVFLLVRKLRIRRRRPADWLLAAALIYLAFYFLAPHEVSQVELVYPRIAIYFWFALILWLAAQPLTRRLRESLGGLSVVAFLGLMFWHLQDGALWNRYMREVESLAPLIEPNRTLFAISMFETTPPSQKRDQERRGAFEAHLMGYLAIERNLVDLTDHESTQGYSPLIFHESLNPEYKLKSGVPGLHVYAFEEYQQGPGRVDYLVVCRIDEPKYFSDKQLRIFEQIHNEFELVATSEPLGMFELYRAKN